MAAASIIGSVAGGIVSEFLGSGGDSGGSSQQVATPAAWEPEAKKLWDEFISSWYGTPASTPEDLKAMAEKADLSSYIPIYSYMRWRDPERTYLGGEKIYTESSRVFGLAPEDLSLVGYMKKGDIKSKNGRIQNIDQLLPVDVYDALKESLVQPPVQPTMAIPSYQERIEQDIAAKKTAGEQFLGAATEAERPYAELLRGLTSMPGQYYKPIGFKGGGFQASFVPRTDIRMVDELKKAALERSMLGTGAAGRQLDFAQTYTPNKAFMDYMAQLQGLATSLNAQRYGLPSTATTATGSYKPGWAETINNALKIYQAIKGNQGGYDYSNADLSGISTEDLQTGNYVWP